MDGTYEGFTHDPSWTEIPSPDYLHGTVHDLRHLTPALQARAVLVDQFEASWPQPLLAQAIGELADLGHPLRHLFYVGDEAIQQVANAMEDDVDTTRQRLLDAVDEVPADRRGYLVWAGSTVK